MQSTPVYPAFLTFLPILIVHHSLLGVAEDVVGLCDLLELVLGVGVLVLVRVIFQGHLAIGLLDLILVGPIWDAQNLVIIFSHVHGLRLLIENPRPWKDNQDVRWIRCFQHWGRAQQSSLIPSPKKNLSSGAYLSVMQKLKANPIGLNTHSHNTKMSQHSAKRTCLMRFKIHLFATTETMTFLGNKNGIERRKREVRERSWGEKDKKENERETIAQLT